MKHGVRPAGLERARRRDRRLDGADPRRRDVSAPLDIVELTVGGCDDQDHGVTVSRSQVPARGLPRSRTSTRSSWDERPPKEGEGTRLAADITTHAGLQQSRARVWRYPPRTTGRRHADHAQEEVFVVVSGHADHAPRRRARARRPRPGSVVAVDPLTPLQMRTKPTKNSSCFVYGAPPVQEGADFLDDVELPPRA